MISLKESILSSTGSGRKASIYNGLAKLLKTNYKHEYIGKNTHKVHIAYEGMCFIDNCFNFYFHEGFEKAKLNRHIDELKQWLKSIGYKQKNSEDQPNLSFLDENQFHYYIAQCHGYDFDVFVFKVENTVVFIEFHKSELSNIDAFYEAVVFALEINNKVSYVEDWKSDKDFVNVLKNKLG